MQEKEDISYERGAEKGQPVAREDLPKARSEDVPREDIVKGEGEIARNPDYHEAEVEDEEPSGAEELVE